jgi:sRNA-binding carbon storage regulator CsrA
MRILHRKRGEQVCLTDCLQVAVLSISPASVTFTICDSTMAKSAEKTLSRPLADACKNKSCYFWFPKGGPCMLVARCEIGRIDLQLGTVRLQLLSINRGAAKIAVDHTSRPGELTEANRIGTQEGESCRLPIDHRPKTSLAGCANDAISMARFRWSYAPRFVLGQIAASLAALAHRW